MNFTSMPLIVMCCYIIGEIYKMLFKKNMYKAIPIIMAFIGGILGVLIFYTNPEIMFNVNNVCTALGLGMISGISSTGTNQMIKQILKRGERNE